MKTQKLAILALSIGMLAIASCGGKSENNNGSDLGPMADTNADRSPGMAAMAAEGGADVGYSEEQLSSINGTWKMTESGEVAAVLTCNYANGTLQYEIVKGGSTTVVTHGEASSVNDSGAFDSNNDKCKLTILYDTKTVTVHLDSPQCEGKEGSYLVGVYTR